LGSEDECHEEGFLRIVSGKMKGRKVFAPPGRALRPTPEKVRDALFNILSQELSGALVLDLYAGTGAVGIEALSRGAGHVTFVEKDRRHSKYLRKNLEACQSPEAVSLFEMATGDFLTRHSGLYDLVFLDPPYLGPELALVLPRIMEGAIISPGGWVVVEHSCKKNLSQEMGRLYLSKQRRYGETVLSFYEKKHISSDCGLPRNL